MKLLFDQNISFRAINSLLKIYPKAKQVRELGLENATDRKIWDYAKTNKYAIVTFDADFYDLATLYGHPPKIIWLRLGNTSTSNLIKLLEKHVDIITAFLTDTDNTSLGCLEIDE